MSKEKMRFSKKIIIITMSCTLVYAAVYLILCFRLGMLPDYSFNAGIFAALAAENWCNAWIKTKEYEHKVNINQEQQEQTEQFIQNNLLQSDVPIQQEPQ